MGNFNMWVMVLIIASLSTTMAINCTQFNSIISNVKSLIRSEDEHNSNLETMGYSYPDNIFGAYPTSDICAVAGGINARLHTIAAQVFTNQYNYSLADFKSAVMECNASESVPSNCNPSLLSLPKYRPIDGRGNNINNPEFGASDTPFARFAPKRYQDGIYSIKKSVTGADLPNPRELVQNVLTKAWRIDRTEVPLIAYSVFALETVLFITHDAHYQTPVQPSNKGDEIHCCSKDGSDLLPPNLSNPACIPIEISKNDTFYQNGNVGCLNLVRSQTAEYTNQVQPGEILNRATSFLDVSLIYGNHDSELKQIRLYKNGLLRMGKNEVLPVDSSGKYIPSMQRFTMVPMASIWPSLFARNHNTLARGLAALNSDWNDETLFQEARRINIATFQYNLITSKAVEDSISGIPINETYSPDRNAATSLEFAIAYRGPHYYIHDEMMFQDSIGTQKKILQSNTIGHIELLENNFDDALRGSVAQVVNVGEYSDEIVNRIGKNSAGYGTDLISMDINRARDQGLPSFLEVRRQCKLKPEIKDFDDLKEIFNEKNVDLLRNAYADVEDIDYYVGGMCEIFEILGNPLVGPTFGCVIANQWDNFAGGDIYYYLNPKGVSPYPFTQPQIDAIKAYSISNLLCANSNLTETAQIWPYAPSKANLMVSCDTFPPMNLTAWRVLKNSFKTVGL